MLHERGEDLRMAPYQQSVEFLVGLIGLHGVDRDDFFVYALKNRRNKMKKKQNNV